MPNFDALMFLKDPLLGGLLAGTVSAALLFAGRRRGGAVLAVACGFLAGQLVLCGRPALPPLDALQRLFYVGALALPLSLLFAGSRGAARWRWGVGACLLVAGWLFLVPAAVRSTWRPAETTAWLLGLAAAGFAFWYCLVELAHAQPAWFAPILLVALALSGAAVIGLTHSAVLAQLAGILAAALFPLPIGAYRSGMCSLGRPAAWLATMLLPGLWLVHLFTADAAPTWSLALLAAALPLAWLANRNARPRLARAYRAAATLVPPAAAIALVVVAARHVEPEAADYPVPLVAAPSRPAAQPSHISAPSGPAEGDDNPFRRWAESGPK